MSLSWIESPFSEVFPRKTTAPSSSFLLLQQKSTKEIHESLVASLGQFCPSYETVRRWCRAFEAGRVETVDAPKSGCPETACSAENTERVRELLEIEE